ncbi:hypothetical protein JTB14_003472 [Gonioctena quinquepunctata]|nr:hypothetical protein JTB14_003472 [Gonioctena quinquepunctata]
MRIEQEKNIIIFGVAENADANKLVRDIMNETTLPEVQIGDIFRLGKVEDNKPKPVKVELSNKKDAIAVMKQKHKLSARLSQVEIKLDKMPKELDELAAIYKELKEQKAEGEKLEVRYMKNKPHIVTRCTKDKNKRARSVGDSPTQQPRLVKIKKTSTRKHNILEHKGLQQSR